MNYKRLWIRTPPSNWNSSLTLKVVSSLYAVRCQSFRGTRLECTWRADYRCRLQYVRYVVTRAYSSSWSTTLESQAASAAAKFCFRFPQGPREQRKAVRRSTNEVRCLKLSNTEARRAGKFVLQPLFCPASRRWADLGGLQLLASSKSHTYRFETSRDRREVNMCTIAAYMHGHDFAGISLWIAATVICMAIACKQIQ